MIGHQLVAACVVQEERASWQLLDEEDQPKFVPQSFDSLRTVPTYSDFIQERFERCLDLYLCPRVRKKRMHIDPESLVPKLPKPQELQPFPTTLAIKFLGHKGKVGCCTASTLQSWQNVAIGISDLTVLVFSECLLGY